MSIQGSQTRQEEATDLEKRTHEAVPVLQQPEEPSPSPPPPRDPSGEQKPLSRQLALLFLSVAAAAAVGLAARFGSPVAASGVALFLIFSAWLFTRSRSQQQPPAEPIDDLRRELSQTRRARAQLFSAVPGFICVLDRNHHVIEANSLYREEFDVTDRLLCYEICKKRSKPCLDCQVDRTFADGRNYSSEETLVARDGRRINVVVHTQPVYDDNGEISAVMEVFTDVTEVKRLQRQLALTGRAVAGMAHRVKNILMGLEGGIFIVNDGLEQDDREAIDQGWEMVERNVGLVTGIVKDLLYCSKDREPVFRIGCLPAGNRDRGPGSLRSPDGRREHRDPNRIRELTGSGHLRPETAFTACFAIWSPTPSMPVVSIRSGQNESHRDAALRTQWSGFDHPRSRGQRRRGSPRTSTTRSSRTSFHPRELKAPASVCWWFRRWPKNTEERSRSNRVPGERTTFTVVIPARRPSKTLFNPRFTPPRPSKPEKKRASEPTSCLAR